MADNVVTQSGGFSIHWDRDSGKYAISVPGMPLGEIAPEGTLAEMKQLRVDLLVAQDQISGLKLQIQELQAKIDSTEASG